MVSRCNLPIARRRARIHSWARSWMAAYEICSLLGEGGHGRRVRGAPHRTLGKRFALKALRKESGERRGHRSALHAGGAHRPPRCPHPGLVEITDFGRLPTGQPFFVMALLEGRSLAALIRRGGPNPDRARDRHRASDRRSAGRGPTSARIVHRESEAGQYSHLAAHGRRARAGDDRRLRLGQGDRCAPNDPAPAWSSVRLII